jgi:hypothetical protein
MAMAVSMTSYEQGGSAYFAAVDFADCPYADAYDANCWQCGWLDARAWSQHERAAWRPAACDQDYQDLRRDKFINNAR